MPAGWTAIARVEGGRLLYRGEPAASFAAERSLEEVVSLLWTGSIDAPIFDTQLHAVAGGAGSDGLSFIHRAQSMLPLVAARDGLADGLRRNAAASTGWRILNLLASVAADSPELDETVEQTLAQAWSGKSGSAAGPIRSALILCAAAAGDDPAMDAAACVAKGGANPWAAATAGLAVMSSKRYAGVLDRALAMFDALEEAEDATALVADFIRSGTFAGSFPADDGDAADGLIALLPRSARRTFVASVLAAADFAGAKPGLPFALASLVRTLGFPGEAAEALFAIGRTIGCVARAVETYEACAE